MFEKLAAVIIDRLKQEGLSIILLFAAVTVLGYIVKQNADTAEQRGRRNEVRIDSLSHRLDLCQDAKVNLLLNQLGANTEALKLNTQTEQELYDYLSLQRYQSHHAPRQ